ncbi:MAG: hydrogenase subunit MbhD domain-containing protein [Pseudomonadota bacterium]
MDVMSLAANWTFDGLLALALLWVGWRVLASTNLFKGIVFFIAFGLLVALSWVRLEAPDVALAEAAIGAGLTGALLLAALSRLRRRQDSAQASDQPLDAETSRTARLSLGTQALLIVFSAVLFVCLGTAFLSLPPLTPGLGPQVAEQLSASGVTNPVTAVLLNFRAYDTLLEMGVLFLALVAVWSLSPAPAQLVTAPGSILISFVRVLVPIVVLAATYLLWIGAYAPGGAFQAGAVLAAAVVLILLAGENTMPAGSTWPLRATLSLGLGVFVAVGMSLMGMGRSFLDFPTDQAGNLILLIEVAATVSIGVTLAALFLGGQPQRGSPK